MELFKGLTSLRAVLRCEREELLRNSLSFSAAPARFLSVCLRKKNLTCLQNAQDRQRSGEVGGR